MEATHAGVAFIMSEILFAESSALIRARSAKRFHSRGDPSAVSPLCSSDVREARFVPGKRLHGLSPRREFHCRVCRAAPLLAPPRLLTVSNACSTGHFMPAKLRPKPTSSVGGARFLRSGGCSLASSAACFGIAPCCERPSIHEAGQVEYPGGLPPFGMEAAASQSTFPVPASTSLPSQRSSSSSSEAM